VNSTATSILKRLVLGTGITQSSLGKMGWFNKEKTECMHMHVCRHYKQAYKDLVDIRLVDANLLEAKTVAGFINYKVRHFLNVTKLL